MAAPTRYESPDVQLRKLGEEARDRGVPFAVYWRHCVRQGKPNVLTSSRADEAEDRIADSWIGEGRTDWPALGVVRWPSDSSERLAWQGAIYSAREGWRRAFERLRPSRPELAVELLSRDRVGDLSGGLPERAAVA